LRAGMDRGAWARLKNSQKPGISHRSPV
jgi:hypothetical protein